MAYLIAGIVVLGAMAAVFLYVVKRALTPRDTYMDPRSTSVAPIVRCRHCDAVVTHSNIGEHGANCPKRHRPPADQ